VNTQPLPGRSRTRISPPLAAAALRQIDRPSPTPLPPKQPLDQAASTLTL
jgi:hypothetical protein